jgi:hypothetical protein
MYPVSMKCPCFRKRRLTSRWFLFGLELSYLGDGWWTKC